MENMLFVALGPANHVAVIDAQTYKSNKIFISWEKGFGNWLFSGDEKTLYNKWC